MQFYTIAALLCLAFGRTRGILFVPLLCVAVMVASIAALEPISIVTWHRADKVLVGGTLALIHAGRIRPRLDCSDPDQGDDCRAGGDQQQMVGLAPISASLGGGAAHGLDADHRAPDGRWPSRPCCADCGDLLSPVRD